MNNVEMLRVIADDYEQAQRTRVVKGEQIRALAQGRDTTAEGVSTGYLDSLGFRPTVRDGKEVKTAADALLEAILKGKVEEPHPYLATAYLAAYRSERRAYDQMIDVLKDHPAWTSWMSHVRGVGPTLGAKLLSRLDLDKANNASSFWLYAGLATVPGQQWECDKCGYVGIFPETYNVTGSHKNCKHLAVRNSNLNGVIRAAQPKSSSGEKRNYDSFTKKTMYLLATSWLKAGSKSFYNKVYRDKIAYYERERPRWEKGRKHYGALRTAEKLFLSHLYEAWCLAVGREPAAPYAEAVLGHVNPGHNDIIRAAEVLEWEEKAKAAAA